MTVSPLISRELLTDSQRGKFVARLFGARFIYLESFTFDTAGSLSVDYDGGYWHYYTLSNGGFYMAPNHEGVLRVISDNGFEGDLSADAFGITCCLYAYSLLSGSPNTEFSEMCTEQFHLLRAYMAEHEELDAILAAVD
ncbi:antirestriction protein KlcA [Comamonadaceae bacterium OS-1]|nr:antirestriction protein KlcA [Comamonadaceae bacterium OS-1]